MPVMARSRQVMVEDMMHDPGMVPTLHTRSAKTVLTRTGAFMERFKLQTSALQ